jgi:hypothetical protein
LESVNARLRRQAIKFREAGLPLAPTSVARFAELELERSPPWVRRRFPLPFGLALEGPLLPPTPAERPAPTGGDLVAHNRLRLEALAPLGLRPIANQHSPLLVDAAEGFGFERTAVQQIAVYLRSGSGPAAVNGIRIGHTGVEGWLTTASPAAGPGIAVVWPPAGLTEVQPLVVPAHEWGRVEEDTTSFVARQFSDAQDPARRRFVQNWSAFYPLMGTYEVLIPQGFLRPGWEYKVVLLGCSVQKAKEVARKLRTR